jgi:hypothetical protein
MDHLVHKHAIALGLSIDKSSNLSYTSALNSYITFCKLHHFLVTPTEEILSFFTVSTCSFIKPDSVNLYLSGIANQLEPFFPEARAHHNSSLLKHTVAGCHQCFRSPVKHKQPLLKSDLRVIIEKLNASDPTITNYLSHSFSLVSMVYSDWENSLSLTELHRRITRKCLCITLWISVTIPTPFSFLGIRATVFMKAIPSSSRVLTLPPTLTPSSCHISHCMINSITSIQNCGSLPNPFFI